VAEDVCKYLPPRGPARGVKETTDPRPANNRTPSRGTDAKRRAVVEHLMSEMCRMDIGRRHARPRVLAFAV
jgi:hypothetical protein